MDHENLVAINRLMGRRFGWQIKRYVPDLLEARLNVIGRLRPDLIIDGGANRGQWSSELRKYDRNTPILAFEPVSDSFQVLANLGLPNFTCIQKAISDAIQNREIHVSGRMGMASSITPSTEFYRSLYPGVQELRLEEIECVTLDSMMELRNRRIYLKLDLEGHEWQALQGAIELLSEPDNVVAIEIETSISESREKEAVHYEIIPWLQNSFGFKVYHLFAPAVSKAGKMNFIDCILTRD